MPNADVVNHFNRLRFSPFTSEDREKLYSQCRRRFSRRQYFAQSASIPSTTTNASNQPSGRTHNIHGKGTMNHDGDGGDDDSDDGDDKDHDPNPFAPTGSSQPHGHGQMPPTTMMADNPFLPQSTITGSPSFSTSFLSFTTTTLSSYSTMSTSTTSSIHQTYISSTPLTATTVLTVSSTSSRTAMTGASSAESTTTTAPSVEVHKPSISAPTIAAAVVASILGAVALFAFAYLLLRYCTTLKAKVFAYRGRRGERLPAEEDGEIVPRGSVGYMSEVNRSSITGVATVRRTMTARSSAANNAAAPGYPADLTNVPVQSEKEPESHPFSNQVPLGTSDVGSNNNSNIPSLRHSFILSMSMGMGSTTGSVSTRPPTYMTNESGSDPITTVINNYAAPSRSPSNSTSSGVHATGLSAHPPTPVVMRTNAGFGLAGAASRQRHEDSSSSLIPSTPTPAYFPAPSPPESVIESPSIARVRKSITPSESASNAPSSPLPFPVGLLVNTTLANVLPAAAPSRWSWNSSSIAVGGRKAESDTAARRSENESVSGMDAGSRSHAGVGAISSIESTPPPPPVPLPLAAVRRSSTASSIMSSNSASRVSLRDMTR